MENYEALGRFITHKLQPPRKGQISGLEGPRKGRTYQEDAFLARRACKRFWEVFAVYVKFSNWS